VLPHRRRIKPRRQVFDLQNRRLQPRQVRFREIKLDRFLALLLDQERVLDQETQDDFALQPARVARRRRRRQAWSDPGHAAVERGLPRPARAGSRYRKQPVAQKAAVFRLHRAIADQRRLRHQPALEIGPSLRRIDRPGRKFGLPQHVGERPGRRQHLCDGGRSAGADQRIRVLARRQCRKAQAAARLQQRQGAAESPERGALDEIGRGTATYDGLSLAWAVVEHIHDRIKAKTLFATHYHELTELADSMDGVANLHVSVKEAGDQIIFLRKVEPGSADRSYGIEVARLAALPLTVIERARQILKLHERSEHKVTEELSPRAPGPMQIQLFEPVNYQIADRIRNLKLDELRPIEALQLLAELQQELKR